MSSRSSDPFRDRLNSVSGLRPKQETHQLTPASSWFQDLGLTAGSDLSPTEGSTTSLMSSTSSASLGSSPCSSSVLFCPWTWTRSLILQHKNIPTFRTEEVLDLLRPHDKHPQAQTGFPPVLVETEKKTCSFPPFHQDLGQDLGQDLDQETHSGSWWAPAAPLVSEASPR